MTEFSSHFQERLGLLNERDPFQFPLHAVPETFRRAAVLLPFWEDNGAVKMVCFVRPMSAPTHAGQVAFPGGACDAGDATLIETALRETHEELGIAPDQVRVVGQLDDAWSGGGFHVSTFVGWLDQPPVLRPDPHEVELAVVADVEPLLAPEAMISKPVSQFGRQWISHEFHLPDARLFGFSADLFVELLAWVRFDPLRRGPLRLRELDRWVEAGMPKWRTTPDAKDA